MADREISGSGYQGISRKGIRGSGYQDKRYITFQKGRGIIARYEEVIRGINGYIRWIKEKRGDKK